MKFTQPIVVLASLAFAASALCAPISSEATVARRSDIIESVNAAVVDLGLRDVAQELNAAVQDLGLRRDVVDELNAALVDLGLRRRTLIDEINAAVCTPDQLGEEEAQNGIDGGRAQNGGDGQWTQRNEDES
ncbi:G/T mismatch-specific thymine DNA glycosylase [Moesziomyces antarcticus T-34]|uniref:G/T mismatch-specific thymine DNA glycosylase n=1 Tax=Pseudozyma antarctica (strain T-34) TaxID=1151754 RepID=M9M6A1_PSEA3|nr:G/T mismatch-specific thymine DNA glycosylase [Moesziomyces antarcticus T-34]